MQQISPLLAHNLLVEGELVRVARTLQAAHVPFIALKGVTFLRRTYGRLDARWVGDNDILLLRQDIAPALRHLAALGYVPGDAASVGPVLDESARLVLLREHEGRTMSLDIHTSPLSPRIHHLSEDLFWSGTERYDLAGTSLRVLSPCLSLLHVVAHCEQHAFCAPRILEDAVAAWNAWGSTIERPRLLDAARATGLLPALDYVLGSAHELGLLRTPPPPGGSRRAAALRRLVPPARLQVAAEGTWESYRRTVASWLLREPRFIATQLRYDWFPPLSRLSVIYGRPAHASLYLRYLTRPLRPVARLLGWTPRPGRSSFPGQRNRDFAP